MGRGVKIPWIEGSIYHNGGGGFKIPWGFNLPYGGVQFSIRGFNIPWM
jgi:hypothetical protein